MIEIQQSVSPTLKCKSTTGRTVALLARDRRTMRAAREAVSKSKEEKLQERDKIVLPILIGMFEDDRSFDEMADALNGMNIFRARAKRWGKSSVWHNLKRHGYIR
jgi:hypothetical protein